MPDRLRTEWPRIEELVQESEIPDRLGKDGTNGD